MLDDEKMDFSITTFNTLMDACARSERMNHANELLKEMDRQNIKPNLVTYSTILKGYCQENKLDKALDLVQSMKNTTDFIPDEIMYNSLLNGCARLGLFKKGMDLLDEMQQVGIKPSNFTLSILVKLASRGRQLEAAFELCQDLPKQYNFRLNVHVYSNLVHACIQHKDTRRALTVFKKMLREKVRPEVRTYTLLIPAMLGNKEFENAAGLLRAALALPHVPKWLEEFDSSLMQPQGGLPKDFISETLLEFTRGKAQSTVEELALMLLQDMKKLKPHLVEQKVKLQFTKKAMAV